MTKNGKGFYQFHGNAFIDICEDRFTDFVIQPRLEFNEGEAFLTMLERANHAADYSTLYVCDRNYFTWNTAAHILVKRQYFLIRAKGMRSSRSTFKGIEMPESGEFDVDASIKIIRSSKKYYKERPNEYRCVSRSLKFDFLDEGDDVSTFPIDFRIVCIRLKSGEYEYLLTNLPRDKFPPHVISELYKLRWKCELGFRKLKFNCGLNSFHSVKRNFIIQEVYKWGAHQKRRVPSFQQNYIHKRYMLNQLICFLFHINHPFPIPIKSLNRLRTCIISSSRRLFTSSTITSGIP